MEGMYQVSDRTRPPRAFVARYIALTVAVYAVIFTGASQLYDWVRSDGEMSWGDYTLTLGAAAVNITAGFWLPRVLRRFMVRRHLAKRPE